MRLVECPRCDRWMTPKELASHTTALTRPCRPYWAESVPPVLETGAPSEEVGAS